MREIKFRGKRTDTGEWAYGGITHLIDVGRVFIDKLLWYTVSDPERQNHQFGGKEKDIDFYLSNRKK